MNKTGQELRLLLKFS